MPRCQKVSPHHRGRRKTDFLVRTSTIFGADVHDPKGCRKTLYKKKVCVDFSAHIFRPLFSANTLLCNTLALFFLLKNAIPPPLQSLFAGAFGGPEAGIVQTLPSYGFGRYGFGFFGPRIAFPATGALWGRATPFFYHFSVHLSSVLGRTELCNEVWTPGPPKTPNHQQRKPPLDTVRIVAIVCDIFLVDISDFCFLFLSRGGEKGGGVRAGGGRVGLY